MGFCIFLITEDLSFRLFGLELSTRSQTSSGSRAGARGTRPSSPPPLLPLNYRPKEEDWGGVRVKLVAWKCADSSSLVLTCDLAFLLPFFFGTLWNLRSPSKGKKKRLIAGYIVYESIQFSNAGAAENLNTSLTKQPTISSPTISFSSFHRECCLARTKDTARVTILRDCHQSMSEWAGQGYYCLVRLLVRL